MAGEQQNKPGRSCVGTGCLVLAFVAVAVAAFLGWRYYAFTSALRPYTSDAPAPLPALAADAQQYQSLALKLDAFKATPPGSNLKLTLTGSDINVLIASCPDWRILRGKIYADISGGLVHLQVSIPLRSIPLLRDRYLNGRIDFAAEVDAKVLHITIKGMELNGQALPPDSIKQSAAFIEPYFTNRLLGDPVIGKVLIKTETLNAAGNELDLTSSK